MVNIGYKKKMVITDVCMAGEGREAMVGAVTQIFSVGIKEKSLGAHSGCG